MRLGGLTFLDLAAKSPAAAIARLEPEIAKKPSGALLALLANAHLAAGDSGSAEKALRQAVSVDPRFTAWAVLIPDRHGQRSALVARAHRECRDVRFGQKLFAFFLG